MSIEKSSENNILRHDPHYSANPFSPGFPYIFCKIGWLEEDEFAPKKMSSHIKNCFSVHRVIKISRHIGDRTIYIFFVFFHSVLARDQRDDRAWRSLVPVLGC